jgi:hypothetical protein
MFNETSFFAILFLVSLSISFAQVPYLIDYQSVARHNHRIALSNQNIAIRISIHNHTPNGTIQYSETRNVTTDASHNFYRKSDRQSHFN